MAPRKEKVEKPSADKAAAAKTLKEMHEQGEIESKAAGKQLFKSLAEAYLDRSSTKRLLDDRQASRLSRETGEFMASRAMYYPWLKNDRDVLTSEKDPKDTATPEELSAMDEQSGALREDIASLRAEQKTLAIKLQAVNAVVTIDNLRDSVNQLSRSKEDLLDRLGPLRAGKVAPVSAERRAQIDLAYKSAERSASIRKAIFREFWGLLCENLPEGTSKGALWASQQRVHISKIQAYWLEGTTRPGRWSLNPP
ncbi:MAG: hypothetical protein M4579_003018 [Chaenotheca gracillima]|nr:MAG: hypothetical protein M4579_003018 [Chaenotheca gracillima]